MTALAVGSLSLLVLLLAVWAGMPVALALAGISLVGVWLIRGDFEIAATLLGNGAWDAIQSHLFGVVPLFVLMGLLVGVADVGRDAFVVANQALRRVRGGLGMATVAANTVFAAITGISIASAAVFTKVAVPEMLRFGYAPRFAVGVVAGSSVLGMLIPPSLLMILYAFLAEQSVGAMFIAGILPGLLLASIYALGILGAAHLRPDLVYAEGRPQPAAAGEPLMSGLELGRRIFPIVLLIGLVIGGIYAGWFTPTEAGAIGAAIALVLAVVRRKLDAKGLWQLLVETGHVTVSISFLIIAASIYTRLLAMSGLPQSLVQLMQDAQLGYTAFLLAYVAIILLLGTIIDSGSIMLIVCPLTIPIANAFGVDLVWWGVVTVLAVEIGLLTPPFGISVYVVKSTLDDPRVGLGDIFRGALPFAIAMLAVLGLLIAFPILTQALQ
ncbi:MAG: TRAP transporter large permease subunit [Enhydrobacter sp.]|nr:MAG: TRAP transporter large permease subunit [Enhydrobacter sp.]